MNIDDRLDRLVERHEALAQSVQLLTQDVHSLGEYVHSLAQSVNTHERYMADIMEATARLLHVAQIHEQRLTRLEGQEGS
jgi:copper oxidase (laccase) domain-containing protein